MIEVSKEMFRSPVARYVTIAGSFRFFGGYAIGFYMPSYFGKIYSEYSDQYSILNSFVVAFCGLVSALSGGYISDYFENKGNYMAKANVCIAAGVLGIPTIALCTLYQENFYFSIGMLGAEYLVAESWGSPAITMILNTISPKNKAFAVSTYLLFTTLAGTFSAWFLGFLLSLSDKNSDPSLYGKYICYFVVFSYAGSIPFFILAGRAY